MSNFGFANIARLITPGLTSRVFYLCIKYLGSLCLGALCLDTFATQSYSATIVYVANADSQDISVFQLDEKNGQLNPVQTFAVGGMVMPMTVAHNKNLLYAALRSEPYKLVILAIDGASGKLTLQDSSPLVDSMANISLDRSGRYLFAASYGGNKICITALDEKGIPQSPAHVLATGNHPHQITTDPFNQFVYLSLLGEDRVDYFRFDATNARLEPATKPAATFLTGSGPRHFVFSPQGNFLYVLNELNAQLHVFKRNTKTGATKFLEAHRLLPSESTLKPWAADIHLTPNGNFLYASERTSSKITGFKINKKTGKLTAIGAWNTEAQPRAFAISPSGRYLTVVGQKSHQISVYAINTASGELLAVDRKVTGTNPNWVEIIALPN